LMGGNSTIIPLKGEVAVFKSKLCHCATQLW
jgi:hypothetical protein